MNELLNNIQIFHKSAELVYNTQDYTSSTILYFKTLFVILDYILLKEQGKTPKDHTERFRMLEKDYPELYDFLDKYFKIYRDTYSQTIEKDTCDKIRKNVRKIIERYKIEK